MMVDCVLKDSNKLASSALLLRSDIHLKCTSESRLLIWELNGRDQENNHFIILFLFPQPSEMNFWFLCCQDMLQNRSDKSRVQVNFSKIIMNNLNEKFEFYKETRL